MAIQEQLDLLLKGTRDWNRWRFNNPDCKIDLRGSDIGWNELPKFTPSADLNTANLSGANLTLANLRGAGLVLSDLRRADLRKSNLSKAFLNMANLSEANLNDANLFMSVCSSANVTRADLSNAYLRQTKFFNAILKDTRLCNAKLYHTKLVDANCDGADFSGAELDFADLTGASLNGANFDGAIFGRTRIANVNLSAVKGLESIHHKGPSLVGIDTIFKSAGNIAPMFLRGCGVPEPFITNMKSLVAGMEPVQFYSCFISYSSKDQEFAERLHADLLARNLRVWFAPEDLKIGDRFQERIEESIRLHDKVMIVLSDASVKSRWVEREVNAAREREDRENRTVLFPIRIDAAVMDATAPWAADLRRQRHIGDFTNWRNHDCYQKAFERLLRDLRAEPAPPSHF